MFAITQLELVDRGHDGGQGVRNEELRGCGDLQQTLEERREE
jgi:hypothetical protein